MAPSFLEERERRRRQRASPLPLPQHSSLTPSPLQRLSVSVSGPRPLLPRSHGFSNLSQFVVSSGSTSSSSSDSNSEMSRTPTPAGMGLGIDLGSGGRRDGLHDGSQRQQDSPVGDRTRGLRGPREIPSALSSAEQAPRSSRPVELISAALASTPPRPPPHALPAASAPPPLSFGRPSSVDAAREAALSALTMAERVGLLASVTNTVRNTLQVVPTDEERLYPAPTMAPEDIGKSNNELLRDIMGMVTDGQLKSLLAGRASEPIELTEEEKERRRLKNKRKSDSRKAQRTASSGGDSVDGESGGVLEGNLTTSEEDVGAKYTTPKGRSINRFKSYDSLGLGYGTASGAGSPTSRQPQLHSSISLSPALTSSPSIQRIASSGFSIHPSRRDLTPQLNLTPRQDLTPRPGQSQANTSTPRTSSESSPVIETPKDPYPVSFVLHQVQVPTPDGPAPEYPAPTVYFYHILGNSSHFEDSFRNSQLARSPHCKRPPLYFFEDERACLKVVVELKIKETDCSHDSNLGINCQRCREYWFAFFELKVMPASLTPEERKRIIDGNRSLRTIRTELDNLMENEAISTELYDMMMNKLPAETPLNGSRPDVSRNTSAVESPPAYNNPTAPSLPSRQISRPEICRVKALYPYPANDANDCSFVVEDEIIVYEKVNDDWWMGKNVRSNKEGVFPAAYTVLKATGPSLPFQGVKTQPYGGGYQAQPQQQYQQQTPYQPSPSQSYSAPSQPSKGSETGKKVGKKLGNAALFGAGATVGSKIVNCIF